MSEMKPGDKVIVQLSQRVVSGIVLQSHDSSIVLLKLESGYNIGIPKDHVMGFKIVKKAEKAKEINETKQNKELPKLGLVVTGGTIASKLDASTGGVSALTDAAEFARAYPSLFSMVHAPEIKMPFMKLSENMNSDDWLSIAKAIEPFLEDNSVRGVLVTHGTDFLHYTAAALSFFFPKLNKPIVLTYSQRSIDRASSDADLNLRCAARLALSEAAGVYLVGHGSLNDDFCSALKGVNAKKLHSSRRDAFKSVNIPIVAHVWPDKVQFLESFNARSNGNSEKDITFNDKIALVKFYPGQNPEILDFYKKEGYKGIVIEGSGMGHVAIGDFKQSWGTKIKQLIKDGITVCMTTQTVFGSVDPYVYSTGRALEELGVLYLGAMSSETAFVKLGWVLGHKAWKTADKTKEMMLKNFCGELPEYTVV